MEGFLFLYLIHIIFLHQSSNGFKKTTLKLIRLSLQFGRISGYFQVSNIRLDIIKGRIIRPDIGCSIPNLNTDPDKNN
jgi:hypothetical protein